MNLDKKIKKIGKTFAVKDNDTSSVRVGLQVALFLEARWFTNLSSNQHHKSTEEQNTNFLVPSYKPIRDRLYPLTFEPCKEHRRYF